MKGKGNISMVCKRVKKATVPTLLNFQNGALAQHDSGTTKFCQTLSEANQAKGALVVADGNIYHGLVEADELTDSYICVRNKRTNDVRIIPIDQVRLQHNVYSEMLKTRQKRLDKESATIMRLKQFSGRKAMRYVTNKEKMNVDISIVRDELDNTLREANVSGDEQVENQQERLDSLRPKFNADASTPREVYDVTDVVSGQLLDKLEEEALVIHGTALEQLPIKSDYLRRCLKSIQQKPKPTATDLQHIKLIVYMDCLASLIKSRARVLKQTLELSGISEKVENDVRERFSDPHAKQLYTRTAFSTEKGLCYFIVLALLISDNFQVNIDDVLETVCRPRKEVIRFAHCVNALSSSTKNAFILRVPKNVPPLPTAHRRKRKNL